MNRALLRVIKDINLGSDFGPWIALVCLDISTASFAGILHNGPTS